MTNQTRPDIKPERTVPRPRRHLILLAIPYLWSIAAIPAVGTTHAAPAGVPLLLWWMLAGVLVTTGVLAIVWRIDERREPKAGGADE
ncbi:hypothetical protein SA2016_0877 [Sinomonas atrocyanea]|uniref:DUF3311 domain-containing protein n=1 Tax=Sinomonas atrocyanea TaxID=37927 RepID=A0A126ZYT4_9MICC|nr:DUF3311 domain-containing protein [Sinomonas atrocyanea]AMM31565.1 hypothetical protein SA2016_0877 [Sinomonas atrocyanea]GEB66347.1 hypothetical protein SAT01_37950 [Sinomonas atrocyanea]GGG70152.1 hypothetical protein GCM10007172_22970 [Sinomonas atrocyanea]